LRMMLTHRKLLQSKAIAIENDLRGTLRNFGLKVGIAGKTKFEARIKELVENLPDLAELVEPMLVVRRTRLFRLVFDSHDGRAWCRFRREARARERHRHCCCRVARRNFTSARSQNRA
ncbi:MAG: hypothetical protein WA661_11895, partial [Xanthobacteraceae bacterium]